jgi:hypothetical protein
MDEKNCQTHGLRLPATTIGFMEVVVVTNLASRPFSVVYIGALGF